MILSSSSLSALQPSRVSRLNLVLAQIFLLIGITAVMTTLTICAHRSSFLLTYRFATVCLLPSRMEPISENSQSSAPARELLQGFRVIEIVRPCSLLLATEKLRADAPKPFRSLLLARKVSTVTSNTVPTVQRH